MNKITFIKPTFPSPKELLDDYVTITNNNFYTNSGPFEGRFEKEIDNFIDNNSHTAVVVNATTALILAINACVKKESGKDEIIVQSFTFAATAESIVWCGYKPVFIDIETKSWQANLSQAESYLSDNQKSVAGILLCNTFGVGNVDIAEWERLSDKYDVPLIIDSAAGLGSRYSSTEMLGTRGECEIFSMHATKPFAVGEGGLVVSKNKTIIDKINQNKNFGFDSKNEVTELGLNAKAPEITSAIGLRQLLNYPSKLEKRRKLLSVYKERLKNSFVEFQVNDDLSTVPFVSTKLKSKNVDSMIKEYKNSKIQVRNYYNPPLHRHSFFKKYKKLSMDATDYLASKIISLPLHDDFTDLDINRITDILR